MVITGDNLFWAFNFEIRIDGLLKSEAGVQEKHKIYRQTIYIVCDEGFFSLPILKDIHLSRNPFLQGC